MLDINIDIDEDKVASFRGINCSYVRYKRFYNHCRLWNNYVLIVAMLDINVKGTLTSSDSLVLIVAMLDINPKDCILLAPFNSSINCGYVRYKLCDNIFYF